VSPTCPKTGSQRSNRGNNNRNKARKQNGKQKLSPNQQVFPQAVKSCPFTKRLHGSFSAACSALFFLVCDLLPRPFHPSDEDLSLGTPEWPGLGRFAPLALFIEDSVCALFSPIEEISNFRCKSFVAGDGCCV